MKHAALVVAALLFAAARPARAEFLGEAEEVARDVVKNTADSFRRGIAIGPSVGYFAGATRGGDIRAGASFGLTLYSFERQSVKERIMRTARERVMLRLAELVRSGEIADLKSVPREVLEDVKREVKNEVQARLIEKPQFKGGIEGAVLQAPGGFEVRGFFGYGISYLTLGLHAGVQRADGETRGIAGPELALALTPIGKVRTPVVDLFLRTDINFGKGDPEAAFVGGARVAFDLL